MRMSASMRMKIDFAKMANLVFGMPQILIHRTWLREERRERNIRIHQKLNIAAATHRQSFSGSLYVPR